MASASYDWGLLDLGYPGIMVCTTVGDDHTGRAQRMVQGDIGSFDTRFERLTRHYADAIGRGELKPGDRFPSARELSEMHGVGRTTAGRVHGTLISMGLIEHRPGVGTFVLELPSEGKSRGRGGQGVKAAAKKVVAAFDEWHSRAKPPTLTEAIEELRRALR
jgi:DNA-binding GntR family transcriptional regulator